MNFSTIGILARFSVGKHLEAGFEPPWQLHLSLLTSEFHHVRALCENEALGSTTEQQPQGKLIGICCCLGIQPISTEICWQFLGFSNASHFQARCWWQFTHSIRCCNAWTLRSWATSKTSHGCRGIFLQLFFWWQFGEGMNLASQSIHKDIVKANPNI